MSVIPATQEAEAGGSQFKGSSGKVIETLFQNLKRNKGLGAWRTWIQSQYHKEVYSM
jgi:hypothetical protein